MLVGTRDAGLRPAHACAVGAIVHDDRRTVTFFVPASRSARLLSDLQDNGRIAFDFGWLSHESYQLKGTYLSSRPTTEADVARQEAYRAKLLAAARQAYPDEIARPWALGFAYHPGVAVTFRTFLPVQSGTETTPRRSSRSRPRPSKCAGSTTTNRIFGLPSTTGSGRRATTATTPAGQRGRRCCAIARTGVLALCILRSVTLGAVLRHRLDAP